MRVEQQQGDHLTPAQLVPLNQLLETLESFMVEIIANEKSKEKDERPEEPPQWDRLAACSGTGDYGGATL